MLKLYSYVDWHVFHELWSSLLPPSQFLLLFFLMFLIILAITVKPLHGDESFSQKLNVSLWADEVFRLLPLCPVNHCLIFPILIPGSSKWRWVLFSRKVINIIEREKIYKEIFFFSQVSGLVLCIMPFLLIHFIQNLFWTKNKLEFMNHHCWTNWSIQWIHRLHWLILFDIQNSCTSYYG